MIDTRRQKNYTVRYRSMDVREASVQHKVMQDFPKPWLLSGRCHVRGNNLIGVEMKRSLVYSLIGLVIYISAFVFLVGCSQKIVMDNQKFQKLEPFKARLIELKEIPIDSDNGTFASPMTLKDYQVTLEKPDGTQIVVSRVSGTFGIAAFTPTIQLDLGNGPTIEIGKDYTFPGDLYKNHRIKKE